MRKNQLKSHIQTKYVQGVAKKLGLTFLLISQLILRVERRVGYPHDWPWQEVSNNMLLDFLRYLVPEKIYILGEILTLIERTFTPLQGHEF